MNVQSDRREQIVELVRQHGFASIESLAQRFGVTPQTVRRDINRLYADAKLLLKKADQPLPPA